MKNYKKLIHYIFPYYGNILGIFFANVFYSIFSVFSLALIVPFLSVLLGQVAPVVVKPEFAFSASAIIDTFYYYLTQLVENKGEIFALLLIAGTMITLSLLSNAFRYLAQFLSTFIRAGILYQIRRDIYQRIILLPLSFFSQHKKGDVMNRIGTDVQEIEWSLASSILIFFRDPIMIIVFLIALFNVSFSLTIISIVILPIVGYLISLVGNVIQRNSKKAQQLLANVSALYEETIGGLRIIKGYNAIDHANEKFKEETGKHYKVLKNVFRINDLGSPLVELLSIITLLIVLLIGGTYILKTTNLQGEIFLFYVVVFARIIPPARHLVTMYYTLEKGVPSAVRVIEILEADEKIVEIENPINITNFSNEIVYKNVDFYYLTSGEKVLVDLSLVIKKGEKIALIGPSGAGKSTLVDLLPRFYDVNSGTISIDGVNIKEYKIDALRSLYGIVNQDVILFHDSILNNIAFGRKVSDDEVIAAAKSAYAHDFIMELKNGYETILGDRGMTLSGGQRQRLSIARAILQKPQILILDEATSALDSESEIAVQQALNSLMKNCTTIIIAHREATLREVDKIVTITNGKISKIEIRET